MSHLDTPRLREPAHRVSPRARVMWYTTEIVSLIIVAAVLVTVAMFWSWLGDRWWIVAAVIGLDVVYSLIVPQWRYLVHRWEATDTAVYTQTGWWSRERRIAPMSRIQTVDMAEGAIARLFGLAAVTVTTASAAGPLSIDGLDRDVARRLVDELTHRADLDDAT